MAGSGLTMSRTTDAAERKGRMAFLLHGVHARCPYSDIRTLHGNKVTFARGCIAAWHKGYFDEKFKHTKGKKDDHD